MKIIGKTQTGFLLSATADEVAQIAGKRGSWGLKQDGNGNALELGSEIKVSDIYKRLDSVGRLSEQLASAQKTLRAVADVLESVAPALKDAASGEAVPE